MQNKKKIVIIVSIIFVMLLTVLGLTYAFFIEEFEGRTEVVSGQIYMNYTESNTGITLKNILPETKESALQRADNIFTFSIEGQNTSKQDIYYAIKANYGDEVAGKNRINPKFVMLYLEEDGVPIVEGISLSSWDNQNIKILKVPANTPDKITKNYTLRMWIDTDKIHISDTDPNADYTTSEWSNLYASLKINVIGEIGAYEDLSFAPFTVKFAKTVTLTDPSEDIDGTRYVIGSNPDNYVWYSGKLWRIVAINSDNTIKLVTQGNMTTLAWDTSSTNTDYSTSQVRSWLNNEFLPTLYDADNLLVDSTWDYTTYSSFPTKEIMTEHSVTEKVGLLNVYEFMMTGGTTSSTTTNTFLNNGYIWWTISPRINESNVWNIGHDGVGGVVGPHNSRGIRPSIILNDNTISMLEGSGTKEKPYLVIGDKAIGSNFELLNNRISGEYINFNDTLYRIVGIEQVGGQQLTKVTMADYGVNNTTLKAYQKFGASDEEVTFSPLMGIGLYLDRWYNADETSTDYASTYIKNNYKNMIATSTNDNIVWYTGPVDGVGYNYTLSKTGSPVQATIGLGYYGEMFSSQFGNVSDSSNHIWLTTKYSASEIWFTLAQGNGNYKTSTNSYGVRPSFYLKSGVKITSGSGMAHDPYEIEYEDKRLSTEVEKKLTLTDASTDIDGTRYVTGDNDTPNYVWYSGKLWRIVSINDDGTIKLVTQGNMTAIAWDTSSTNTDYSTSQVRRWLNNEFLPTLYDADNLLLDSTWDYTTYAETPVTKITPTSVVENEKVGLLTIYDYFRLGTGSSSFLNNGYYWWTMSPQTDGSNVWYVNDYGDAYGDIPDDTLGVRPSVNLKSDIQIMGGAGTKLNPYVIGGDKDTGVTSELLSNRISGEYINFNDVLYRIVGTEEIDGQKLTKIRMADYSVNSNTLNSSLAYGADYSQRVFSPTYGIGLYLEEWYQADSTSEIYSTTYIKDNYKAMIATSGENGDNVVWYTGPTSGTDRDYTLSRTGSPVSATIGLGYYGEMFSSQFGDGYNSSTTAWLMTIRSSSYVWGDSSYGTAYKIIPTDANGARPSLYLKSDVKITGGSGMPHDPYEITM